MQRHLLMIPVGLLISEKAWKASAPRKEWKAEKEDGHESGKLI